MAKKMTTADGGLTVEVVTLNGRDEFRVTDRHGYLVGGGAQSNQAGRHAGIPALAATLTNHGYGLADLEEAA